MTRPFRFALQCRSPRERTEWRDTARQAEDLGYSTLQVADHLGTSDPFAPLVAAADATEHLRVGTLVLNNELHHPVLLARTAATVDLLCGGRLELGLGTGYAESEHLAMNIPLAPPGERVRRFGAALGILRTLLDGGHAVDDTYGVDVAELGVTPVQQPLPFLVGGHGRHVLALAAEYAQVVQLTGLVHGPDGTPTAAGFGFDDIATRVQWLRGHPRFDELELSALVQVTRIGPDGAAAVDELARELELPGDVVARSPFLLLGSVHAVCEQLVRQRDDLGISYLTVRDATACAPIVARLAGT